MVKIPKYDKNEWKQIREYVKELLSDDPENDFEVIIPLSIAMLKNAEDAATLNKIILCLTVILSVLTTVLLFVEIRSLGWWQFWK